MVLLLRHILCLWQDKVIISDNVIKWRHDFSKHKNVSTDRTITSLFVLLFVFQQVSLLWIQTKTFRLARFQPLFIRTENLL